LLVSVVVLVALLAAAIPLALGGGGSAHALPVNPLLVDKRCGAQASVGQPVKYIIDITNTSGDETLTIDAVDDPLLGGDISANFPASLAPGETASWTAFRGILESDLPGPVINTVTVDATGSSSGPQSASDSCTTDIAAMTLTKTAEFVNGDTVFTFVITNNHFRGQAVTNALQLIHLLTGRPVKVPPPLLQRYPELEPIATRENRAPSLFT